MEQKGETKQRSPPSHPPPADSIFTVTDTASPDASVRAGPLTKNTPEGHSPWRRPPTTRA